jgi:carboxylesterase
MFMLNGAFQGEEHQSFTFQGTNNHAALLVHGFPGSPREMRPVAQVLHGMGWTTRGVLLPGFGPEIETMIEKHHTDWETAVNNALVELQRDHDTVIVAGISMGGALSIQAVAKHGADGLILFAPFWTIDNLLWKALPVLKHVVPRFRPFSIFKPDFSDPEFQKGTRNFMPNADFNDPAFQQATRKLEVHTHVFDQIRAVGVEGYKHAPQINVPTLVIQGTSDELVTVASTQKLLARFQGYLEYHEVDTAHNPIAPEQEAWAAVSTHIQSFVQDHIAITTTRGDDVQP